MGVYCQNFSARIREWWFILATVDVCVYVCECVCVCILPHFCELRERIIKAPADWLIYFTTSLTLRNWAEVSEAEEAAIFGNMY